MLTDFQNSFTIRFSSTNVIKQSLKIPSHLKCIATLPCESKCQETTDNLKQISRLTINFTLILLNLLQLLMFSLTYVTMNIHVLSWLEYRCGDVYATDQCHR